MFSDHVVEVNPIDKVEKVKSKRNVLIFFFCSKFIGEQLTPDIGRGSGVCLSLIKLSGQKHFDIKIYR